MFSTLIFGLALSSATSTCAIVAPGTTGKYALFNPAPCEQVIKEEKDKICDSQFNRRSGHGEAVFDPAGKQYGKSELTCKVTCDYRYYLTKGGKCNRHGK